MGSFIDDEKKIQEFIVVLRDRYNSSKGYFLSALGKYNRAKQLKEGSQASIGEYKNALKKVKEGFTIFPNDENLMYLQCKIFKNLKSDSEKKYYEYLNSWYQVTTKQNATLMYELGRTAFLIQYYDISKNIFLELQNTIGIGHSKRSKTMNPITRKGNPFFFSGEVAEIYSKKEGFIKCTSLPELRSNIPFRPISARFTVRKHDFVGFYIAFSFRGPYAVNITKK